MKESATFTKDVCSHYIMRVYLHITLLFLALLGLTSKVFAQDSTLHAYIGASANFLGVSDAGWGVELGLRYKVFYLGAEYSYYGYKDNSVSDGALTSPSNEMEFSFLYYTDPHIPITYEHSYCLNGGAIVNNTFWLGYTALVSEQGSVHPIRQTDGSFRWTAIHEFWFDFGPDFRIEGWNHLLLNLAYSHRRGIKSGLAYIL